MNCSASNFRALHAAWVAAAAVFALTVTAHAQPSDARIKEILTQRIELDKQAVGLAAVVVEGDKVRIVTHGTMGLEKSEPITPDTLFEVGARRV